MEKIKHLQKLAEVFDTDKIITSDEIEQVLKGILVIMNSFKKDNQTLNKETKEAVEILLDRVLTENAKLKELVTRETSDQKEDFAKQVKELKDLVSKIQTIKPIDGITPKKGEDYFTDDDKTEIVEDVLAKIKLPEYEVYTLEEKGEDIVAEINALPTNEDEYKIDFSHIKNAPEFRGGGGSTARNLYQLMDVQLSTPTDNQVLTYDATTNTWKNENATGGGTVGPGTINELAYFDTTTSIASLSTATYPSLTELSYGKGVTSAIQTQINAKAPSTAPTFATSITGSYLTANEMLITDGSKNIISAAVVTYPSLTELTYLKGVTSAIQTQLNAKQASDAQLTSLAALSYTGNAGKFIRVNAGETDFELAAVSGSGTVTSVAMTVPTGLTITGSPVTTTGTLAVALDTGYVIPLQTTLDGYVKTDQTVGQTIGATGARLTKLWATDITVTNAITGSVTGNAGTVTNATLTTALTVNTGTVTLTGNVANTSVLTIGAGAVSVSGTNTGDQTSIVGITGTKAQFDTAVTDGNFLYTDAIGVSVQAYDADLTTWAGITPGTGVGTALGVNVGSAGAFVTFNGALGTPSSGTLTNCTFPTLNQNTSGSAATLTTTRTIWGQNFNGSANVTGTLALGTADLTLTGSIGATGARATKVWTADLESTNMPTVGGTSLTTVAQTFQNKTITNSNNVLGGVTMTLGSDADGDTYYRASNVLTRLPKGTANQVLAMNAGATAPEWQTPAGGGNPGWDFVSYTTATNATSVTVSSLDLSTDGSYFVVLQVSDLAAADDIQMQMNSGTSFWYATTGFTGVTSWTKGNEDNNRVVFSPGDSTNDASSYLIKLVFGFGNTDNTNTLRPFVTYEGSGMGDGASGNRIVRLQGGGYATDQTNVTSLVFSNGQSGSDWKVWVSKGATA